MKTCTDCGSEIEADEMQAHLQGEHGVMHALADEVCPHCGERACERARALEGTR